VGGSFGGAAPLAVLSTGAGAPGNGELISATFVKTSGRTSAAHEVTGEPASWPTMAATDR